VSVLDGVRRALGGVWAKGPQASARRDSAEELFDEEFQRKLDSLALASRRMFSGRMRAERRTKKAGSGVEFADHRDYQPGDDFRYLDWNVYQRMDRLLVRLFEEEEDLHVAFVLDASGSMGFGEGAKLRYAKRIVAALGYVALSGLDRVSVTAVTDKLETRLHETRSKGRIFTLFEYLRGLQAGGRTDLGDAMKAFVARNKRPGVAVLVSDLYDPAGFERGINVLRFHKFEVLVVHVVDARDARPPVQGDVLVYDCESGDEREVTVTPGVLAAYARAYEDYLGAVERFCAGKQVGYVRADVSVPFDELVLRVLRRGGFLQ
jgi:uncharacterized protein (DUF58 family)